MPYRKKTPLEPGGGSSVNSIVQFEAEPYHYAIPERTLRADLIKVARRLKARAVFSQQYEKHGRFSSATYRYRFGSWEAALRAAGLEPCYPKLVDEAELVADIKLVALQLGRPKLTRQEYTARGRFGITTVCRRFGSWTNAVLAAGLDANPVHQKNPPREALLKNMGSVWRVLGRQPRGRDLMAPLSRFSLSGYLKQFGTLRNALHCFLEYHKQLGDAGLPQGEMPILIRHITDRSVGSRMRYRVLLRDFFKCRFCGRSPAVDPAVRLVVDHVKPWSAGGESVLENLQTLCQTCNAGKSNL